ncbi:MAG: Uma2 family endonuclease [Amaricoccus sp.]
MEHSRRTAFTADEFIAWAMEQPGGRYELHGGFVVTMASERVNHLIAKRNVLIALHRAIGVRGLACQAFPDGMSVPINEGTVYEPDALVRCGPPLAGDAVKTDDPVIVVEVVSPSSRGTDRGAKLAGYFTLPSVRHYLIVDTDARTVVHHRRDADGRIEAQVFRAGDIALDPPGLVVGFGDLFDGLSPA